MNIGIVLYSDNGNTQEQLVIWGDLTIYSARTAGKNQFRYLRSGMDSSAGKIIKIKNDLRIVVLEKLR